MRPNTQERYRDVPHHTLATERTREPHQGEREQQKHSECSETTSAHPLDAGLRLRRDRRTHDQSRGENLSVEA